MSDRKPGAVRAPRIDRIDPATSIGGGEKAWVSVLKAFNPIGPIAEAYAKTLAYRIETKRLALEAERVRAQARNIKDAIDKTYELKMEELRHRRIALERTFDLAEQQLSQLHIERMEVLKMAQLATAKTLAPDVSLEERRLFKELATEITKQLPSFGERANQNLEVLVRALPPIEMPRALLEGGD
jgi:predicted ABC-class ATPase